MGLKFTRVFPLLSYTVTSKSKVLLYEFVYVNKYPLEVDLIAVHVTGAGYSEKYLSLILVSIWFKIYDLAC